MELLLLFLLVFFGIIACVWVVSEAFSSGGIYGIFGLIAWVLSCMWFARETYSDKDE